MKLTSRQIAPNIGMDDLIHIVLVNDQAQDPNGSSYKATIQQVVDLLNTSMADMYWISGTTGAYAIKALNDSKLDATNDYAVAEGYGTLASGYASHTEGVNTIASGSASHAEGNGTEAFGIASHAGGARTLAIGDASFVHGEDSVASASGTIVLGNNITGTTSNTTYVETLNIKTVGVYADNTAAVAAGLEVGTIYRTSTGQLMIRY